MMRAQGALNWLAYQFARHRVANLPLAVWLAGLTSVWIALLALGEATQAPAAFAAAALGMLLLLAVALGSRGGYVIFRPATFQPPSPVRPLVPEEKIPARATGFLEVGGIRQYFADVQAWFETVETREHVIIARNPVSRFLLIAKTREHEGGMWYAFFRPEHIRGAGTGVSCFGWRASPALKVVFRAPDRKADETMYLSFENEERLHRVLSDLLQDAVL